MSRHQRPAPARRVPPAFRQAFERLDAVLAANTNPDNTAKIRLLRLALFGDVDRLQQSDPVKIPE